MKSMRRCNAPFADLAACGATLAQPERAARGAINDDVGCVGRAERKLFAAGCLPYYLHLLDPVRGAAHFNVGAEEAAGLMRALAARLPGYLVPRLVREQAGASY